MLRNYLITLVRQLRRKPGFYLLNITGLAVGLATFVLMYESVSYELSFDKFHERPEDIYRVNFHYKLEGRPPYEGAAVFAGVGPAMEAEFPGVESTTRIVSIWGGGAVIRVGENRQSVKEIQYAESSLFEVFDLPVLDGKASSGLEDVHTAMLSKSLNERLFQGKSGVGETIEVLTRDGKQNYLVTGIYEVPPNSHYYSEALLSLPSLEALIGSELDAHWAWFDFITYVKFRAGTDPEQIEARFPAMIDKYATGRNRNSQTIGFELIPVTDIHLNSHIDQEIGPNGDSQTVVFMLVIATLILSIAWINYINLYTAQATERGKEVGIRKTLGSEKGQLRIQFLLEAFAINFLAMLVAIVLIYAFVPVLSHTLNLALPESMFEHRVFWWRLLGLWVIGSLLSGVYPAMLISGFEPIRALSSGNMRSSGKMRRVLVIWQFMASAGLIVGASTVFHQLREMNAQPTGMNTEDVLVIKTPQFMEDHTRYYRSLNLMKSRLEQYNGVSQVTFGSDMPGNQVGWRGASRVINSGQNETGGLIYKMVVGLNYVDVYEIPILAGRNFQRESDSLSVMLNEKALTLYGFDTSEEAIGKQIYFSINDTLTVVGVVKDHYQESLREPVKPTAFLHMEEELMYLFVRVDKDATSSFVDFAETEFQQFFPDLMFDWLPLERQLNDRHATENSFLKAFNAFVLLSFFISALGLVGLAAYLARKRQKEMGLRKVLGSGVSKIVLLFFKDFARLALIGNLLALPLIYFFANRWLDQFAFRTGFLWWLPMLALIVCLLLAFSATIYHVLKVSRVNPVNVLRNE